jgi:hypothetical protein
MINYNNKSFKPVNNTENGETSPQTIFEYKQKGNILMARYQGGNIMEGHLMGKVSDNGEITMHYHQINEKGELNSGICHSRPQIMENGKLRLYETWQWLTGDQSKGQSVIEEI